MPRTVFIAAIALLLSAAACGPTDSTNRIKPITGTLINIQWPDARYTYMNERQAAYACDDWALKVSEMAEIGIEYIILQSVAQRGKAFYTSAFLPGAGLACDDPVEAILQAAEKRGVKVFLSCEFVQDEDDHMYLPPVMEGRRAIMRDVAARYGASPAFYGWYFSLEGNASRLDRQYAVYVNMLATEARKLTPGARILIAPRGLEGIQWSDDYLRTLESMDIDIVAYQDKVACSRSSNPLEVSRAQFAAARTWHKRVPRIELWANVETFSWEGTPNSRESALVPAPFSRVLEQMAAVAPYVDRIIAFTMLGMADKPGSPAPTGHPTAGEQYRQYMQFLDRMPEMLVLEDAIVGRVWHAAIGAKVVLNSDAELAGRESKLTDGRTASLYDRTHGWVKFKHGRMDITVDLRRRMNLDYVGIHLLADAKDSIFLPERVDFSVSVDGAEYESIGGVEPYPWRLDSLDTHREIVAAPRFEKGARYVRITSRGIRIPNGANRSDTTAIFASEIIINPEVRGIRRNRR